MLYFAYGSNMHKSVFQGRRMISPAESLPAVLPGWRLTFGQPGLPYSEPAFAAVEPVTGSAAGGQRQQQPEVHGVVHRITPSQWNYVLETEGASSQDKDSESGYLVVEATAVAYDGRELPGVMTLSVHEKTKARLQVGGGGRCGVELGPGAASSGHRNGGGCAALDTSLPCGVRCSSSAQHG